MVGQETVVSNADKHSSVLVLHTLEPGECLSALKSKWIFAIRFAGCRVIKDPPTSGSPHTAYCSAQLKLGTCLVRLKAAEKHLAILCRAGRKDILIKLITNTKEVSRET